MHIALVFVLFTVIGCSSYDEAIDSPFHSNLEESFALRSAWDGTVEGAGAVSFLNSEWASFDVLDNDVALDRRAAWYLVSHRDGSDATFGTADDNLFDSMTEVDSVYWVGPKTIGKIINYASADGWIPSGDDYLGSWDGVDFTVDEAEMTMTLVNLATEDTLDFEVPLDSRAVSSILAARPVTTVAHLSDLYYVGGSALTHLREHAAADGGL